MKQQKLSQKTWFVVLLLIFFFPVGLYLMWNNKKFNMVARIIISAFFGIYILVVTIAVATTPLDTAPTEKVAKHEVEKVEKVEKEKPKEKPVKKETEKPKKPEKPKATKSQEQAVSSAKTYLSTMAFSKQGLIEQLEFEQFSNADATYAVDNIKVDWNKQAEKSAKTYLDTMSFSRQGLIDQLVFDGFTQEQAQHGVDKAYK